MDKSKQSISVPSTIAGLESWLNEAEQVVTSSQGTAVDSIAQLDSAIRSHRVCTCFTDCPVLMLLKKLYQIYS